MFDYVSLATYKSTRDHSYTLFVNRMRSCVHSHCLFNYIVNIWNTLPSCYFNANIVSCFKSKLEQFNFSPHILGRTLLASPCLSLLHVYVGTLQFLRATRLLCNKLSLSWIIP